MDQGKFIVRLNIEHFRRLLATETNPTKLETVTRLLDEEEAKLRDIERRERETMLRQIADQERRLLQERERERRCG